MSDSVWPHTWQPTRLPRPWDSPGKNTGVGCHFLLQCMKVKSESEVAQSCPTLSDPMDCSLPGSSIHGIFQARVLEWGAIAFSVLSATGIYFTKKWEESLLHNSVPLFPPQHFWKPAPTLSRSMLEIFIYSWKLSAPWLLIRASLVAQMVKNLLARWETWVWSLGWEDPLEESMATHSRILAWRIPIDRGA